MASYRITVRVPGALVTLLRNRARTNGQTLSSSVRTALASYLRQVDRYSAYALAEDAGLIGCARRAPKDLSTNRRYLTDVGRNK